MVPKNIHILIFFSLNLIGMVYNEHQIPNYKCMDDDLEMDDICGFYKDDVIFLGKTCRWNQVCSPIESNNAPTNYYKCQKVLNKKHEGKRCKTGGDCLSGVCDKKCKLNKEHCTNNYSCDKGGYYCKNSNCVKFIDPGQPCELGDVCKEKYGCNAIFPGNTNGVCVRYGSLSDGKKASNGIFCKSGIITDDGTCVTVLQDSECKLTDAVNNKYSCSPTVSDGTHYLTIYSECAIYNKNPICKVSKLKSSFFEDYISKYKKMNTKRILKKKYFRLSEDNGRYFYSKKLLKKYFKYYYFEDLRKTGVMNEDGKIEKDCEFDYHLKHFYKTNRSSYIKLGSIAFGLILLLF